MAPAFSNQIRNRAGLLWFLVAIVLIVCPGNAETCYAQTTISIADTVEVDNTEILLGQLAEVKSTNTDLVQALEQVRIGRAPAAGRSRSISRDYILLRMRQSGFDPSRMKITIPNKVNLTRRAITISAADLEMMVREYVAANPLYQGAEMTIKSVRIPGDVMLPKGDIRHEIQYLVQSRASGTLPLNIYFSVDDKPVRRVMATVEITLMKNVPVTKRPIARYQMIRAEDLMLQPMDVTDLPANTVFTFEEISGQRAKRSIGPRKTLRKDQLEYPPAVKKGDRVRIVAESGGLRITTLGEVKNHGKIGDRVKVVNLESKKLLFARVVDAHTVQVEF